MNNKINLFGEYVNFVDTTKKQNIYFKLNIILIVIILSFICFLFFVQISE